MTFKEFNDQRDESAFALARLRRDISAYLCAGAATVWRWESGIGASFDSSGCRSIVGCFESGHA